MFTLGVFLGIRADKTPWISFHFCRFHGLFHAQVPWSRLTLSAIDPAITLNEKFIIIFTIAWFIIILLEILLNHDCGCKKEIKSQRHIKIYGSPPTRHPRALFCTVRGVQNFLDKWKEDIVDELSDKDWHKNRRDSRAHKFSRFRPIYSIVSASTVYSELRRGLIKWRNSKR